MKKTLLLPLLLASSLIQASNYKYEISPMLGYNVAEGNVGIEDDGHYLGAAELQYNLKNSKISPEISVLYSPNVEYDGQGDTSITRTLLNGVYSFKKIGSLTPFAKAGLGYEFVSSEVTNYNEDGIVLDAGAGLKIPLAPSWAFKAEAMYLAKVSNAHNSNADNNFVALLGLTYSFGAKAQKEVVPEPVIEEEEVVVVIKDSDGDGINDNFDRCPNTPANTKVDGNGCKIDLDVDKDGVINSKDLCPNTPIGEAVNSDGCPATVNLHINFANNSADIAAMSNQELDKYATFLTTYTNYSARIVGYTDSKGSASYNKKLSQKRAEAVVKALQERGVNASQLKALGMGEANPVADNATAAGRAQNRRIEAELTRN
jgi:OOP family OmpA-OmpF porin